MTISPARYFAADVVPPEAGLSTLEEFRAHTREPGILYGYLWSLSLHGGRGCRLCFASHDRRYRLLLCHGLRRFHPVTRRSAHRDRRVSYGRRRDVGSRGRCNRRRAAGRCLQGRYLASTNVAAAGSRRPLGVCFVALMPPSFPPTTSAAMPARFALVPHGAASMPQGSPLVPQVRRLMPQVPPPIAPAPPSGG